MVGRGFDGERKREKCDVYIIILFNCVIYIIIPMFGSVKHFTENRIRFLRKINSGV